MEDYKQVLIDFCNKLIAIEDKEWKPMQVFRSDAQVERDEARHDMAYEISEMAREVLRDIKSISN